MKITTYMRNPQTVSALGGGKTFSLGKNVNIPAFFFLLVLSFFSCGRTVSDDTSSVPCDSTLWRSLQGFWRVEAIHFDRDTTFFAPREPNFLEISGADFRQYYLVNAPKTLISAPNRADLEEILSTKLSLKAPDTLLIDDLPAAVTFSGDSSRVELRTADRGWRAVRIKN